MDRKYNQLSSDVFNNGHVQGYNREAAMNKASFGTNADWKCQGGYARPQNAENPVHSYQARQQNLASQGNILD